MNQNNRRHQAPPALAGRRLMTTREYKHIMGDPSDMKLWRDEQRGIGPKPVRQNGRRYWLADEVFAYLDELAATRSPPDEKLNAAGHETEVQHGTS